MENEISTGATKLRTHNKEIGRFTRQIKTADQAIYADSEISRVASLILKNGGSHVQLKGINAQALNQNYNKNNLLSIRYLHFFNRYETLNLTDEVKEEKTSEETINEVAGMGFAPTIRTLKMGVSKENLVNAISVDGERFARPIKTADQAIYVDSEISRVASLILKNGGSHVRLQDAISNRAINLKYIKNNLLSIGRL